MRALAEIRQTAGSNIQRILVAVMLMTVLSITAHAQRITGTLRGAVNDQNGAAVTGAKITATNQQTGVAEHTTSTSSGSYEFPSLLTGPYSVSVQSQGFRESVSNGVNVSANSVTDSNIVLSVGAASETVEVNAGVAEVQTTTSTINNDFSPKEVLDIPTGSGSPLQLAVFAPNTTAQQGGITGV